MDLNKKINIGSAFIFTLSIIIFVFVLTTKMSDINMGGSLVQNAPTYTTATSTKFKLGHQLSQEVLQTRSRRAYVIFCSLEARETYLELSGSAITATTSADIVIPSGSCFEFNNDNLFVGSVHAMTETSTTSGASFVVTEFVD